MSLTIKNITVKNFMSVGNVSQAVNFDTKEVTLVLGENLDLGGTDSGSRNGTGKSQPLSALVLTPSGWRKMGDLHVGDKVIAHDGTTTTINGVYPQGKLKTYKVTFADGRSTRASGDHLWSVYSNRWYKKNDLSAKTKVLTTDRIAGKLSKYTMPSGKKNSCAYMYAPLPSGVEFETKELSINPWLLGFLLGDGCMSKKCGLGFSSADAELIENATNILKNEHNLNIHKLQGIYDYGITGIGRGNLHPLRILLDEYNLNGLTSSDKFIPTVYKNASRQQRLEILQGLFDSDGTVDRRTGTPSFTSTSYQLASDVAYIVRSLGGLASVSVKQPTSVNHSVAYTVSVRTNFSKDLFTLSRKKELVKENYQYKNQLRARFDSIVEDGYEECQCISIDHPSSLYITDDFVVTHNTTIVNALSYALYGVALTNIKKDNLINKINSKGMLVTVSFEKNGVEYRIERGRKPNVLKFVVDGHEHIADNTDESQGDSRETQRAIELVIGMGHTMFKHLVALNTYTEPFLSLKSNEQRQIIEELLGITILSEKAELLKEQIRAIKEEISTETTKIETIKASNDRIQQSINAIAKKQKLWEQQHTQALDELAMQIARLETINIDQEIQLQRDLELWLSKRRDIDTISSAISKQSAVLSREEAAHQKLSSELHILRSHKCHSCGQDIHDDKHTSMLHLKEKQVNDSAELIQVYKKEIEALTIKLDEIGTVSSQPSVFYSNLEEALNHKNTLDMLETNLVKKSEEENPYTDQISELQNSAVQVIDWTAVNELNKIKDHQEFLHKLLTNKDSFVRKRIIDQNLAFLNQRLSFYLDKIGLPHIVEFQNDLSVIITQLGQDLDFDNLSRGERNRVILSMSWAFRDVWESLYHSINLVFIDELIDSGLDLVGVEMSISLLKKMMRERNKSVFLISHREELSSRVNRILHVIKENGFTEYQPDVEFSSIV